MAVGKYEAVRRKDETGAVAPRLSTGTAPASRLIFDFDIDYRGAHPLGGRHNRPRIGIEQIIVGKPERTSWVDSLFPRRIVRNKVQNVSHNCSCFSILLSLPFC